jgi:hypothetical protein
VKFAGCMRSNGVPNWPNPGPVGTGFSGIGVAMTSPSVEHAVKVCADQAGLQGFSGGLSGAPGSIMPTNGGPGGGSAGNGGPGADG